MERRPSLDLQGQPELQFISVDGAFSPSQRSSLFILFISHRRTQKKRLTRLLTPGSNNYIFARGAHTQARRSGFKCTSCAQIDLKLISGKMQSGFLLLSPPLFTFIAHSCKRDQGEIILCHVGFLLCVHEVIASGCHDFGVTLELCALSS